MSQPIKTFFIFLLGMTLLEICSPAQNQVKGTNEKKTTDPDVVFVFNVPQDMHQGVNLLKSFLSILYHTFLETGQSQIRDTTPPGQEKPLETRQINLAKNLGKFLGEIKRGYLKIPLKREFNEVFDLAETYFPAKSSIVLFVSRDEHSLSPSYQGKPFKIDLEEIKGRKKLSETIKALKKSGFAVFSVLMPINQENKDHPYFMAVISEWAKSGIKIEKKRDTNIVFEFFSTIINKIKSSTPTLTEEKPLQAREQGLDGGEQLITEQMTTISGLKETNAVLEEEIKITTSWMWIFLGLFFLSIIISFLLLTRAHKRADTSEEIMLWGKLIPPNGNNSDEDKEIILSDKPDGHLVETPNDKVPDFRLKVCHYWGRRALCAQVVKGNVDYYYSKNGKEIKTKNIDENTTHIRISSPDREHSCEYEYNFVNLLKQSCLEPVEDIKKQFVGRKETITVIEKNFLQARKKCANLIISGMKNSGKTSLMRYLTQIHFKKDDLAKMYAVGLVEFDPNKHTNFNKFEEDCEEIVEKLGEENKERKILFIDDYDNLILKYEDDFKRLIQDYRHKDKLYLVLAGRRPEPLIREKFSEFFPPPFEEIVLLGIDRRNSFVYSIELINSILDEIGIQRDRISNDLKAKISYYASGLPYFCKRVALECFKDWLQNYCKKSLNKSDVEQAALKVSKKEKREYLKKFLPNLDENEPLDPNKVYFQDIMDRFDSKEEGKIKKSSLKAVMTGHERKKIRENKKESFKRKIELLKKMGFLVEEGDSLIAIPYLFYHQEGAVLNG